MSAWQPFRIVGTPAKGGILVVSDHASNHVPADIDLGVHPELLDLHVAVDIGVRQVGELMARHGGFAAFQATASRLVCDVNRDPHAPAAIPIASDGHAVPGNAIDHAGHLARIARFHTPYHAALAQVIENMQPILMVSLHSFTPQLSTHPEDHRPWQVGVLYNQDERAARLALPLLEAEGLAVGDQKPYSGHLLNYTMDRHAEAQARPYVGIEVRQDEIGHAEGQAIWAERLVRISRRLAQHFAG